MRVYASPHQRPNTETVLAIGSFDGVHLGHQALMTALLERARFYSVPSVVVTFDPPTRVLFQGVRYLCTLPEKVAVLERYKVDEVIAIPFDLLYAGRPKDAFLEDLKVMRPRAIIVGEDFGFGKGRGGSTADLEPITGELVRVPLQTLEGVAIKSTFIRACLDRGDVEEAARFLGRSYDAIGVVVHGDARGRTIGYPTANVAVPSGKALPLGVFAVHLLEGGRSFPAFANVGYRPTVSNDGQDLRLEVHVFDFAGDLYGAEIQIKFRRFIRRERKFSGLEELKGQLAQDEGTAREMLLEWPSNGN